MSTLMISNVDLRLLEQQRLVLHKMLENVVLPRDTEPDMIEYRDALEGVLAMLDAWSDELYFEIVNKDAAE